ncbi:hypothetical protein E2C01_059751 [Portunus trituberculatus]|uniref:Uncharacterized protein n=1 Tax=Portunus trituberculatus TaxID=210409 RepID=A0A5B7H685_PORTR|nr:hypothetical protein [Portunus trituberculatus]
MKVGDLQQSPPLLVQQYEKTVTMVVATHQQVMCLLRGLNTQKATGPDDFSPHLLKRCFQEMAAPLTQVNLRPHDAPHQTLTGRPRRQQGHCRDCLISF